MDDDLYIYPYKASMLVPCPFETLKLELDASKTEINQAADAIGTDEADDARRKALSIYYHPPCNKARRLKRMREHDKGSDDERHMRRVLEKVVSLYKTEFYHIGLRGRPGFDESEFADVKSKWNEQVRYEAEEIFWNGYGDCRTKLRKTETRVKELEAEMHRLKSSDKQQLLEARIEIKTMQQELKTAQQRLADGEEARASRLAHRSEHALERENDALREELDTAYRHREKQAARIGELEDEVSELRLRIKRVTSERDQAERDRDAAECRLAGRNV